jgi:hypothetical protein
VARGLQVPGEDKELNATVIIYAGEQGFGKVSSDIGRDGKTISILHYGAHFSPLVPVD